MAQSSNIIESGQMWQPGIVMGEHSGAPGENKSPSLEVQHHVSPQESCTTPSRGVDSSTTHDAAASHHLRDQQSQVLPHSRLMVVFPVLALAQFTAYLDQTSISAAVPAIGDAVDLGASLPWVATAYLLATTAVQLANGRLSDIFGRKLSLITSLAILALGREPGRQP